MSLAAPAYAADGPGNCTSEISGQQGLICTHVGSNLYPGVVAGLNAPRLGARLGLLTEPNCDNVSGLLINARLAVATDRKTLTSDRALATKAHQDLVTAQKNDNDALATRNAAVATAQHTYAAGLPYTTVGTIIPPETQAQANARATAAAVTAAQTTRNIAVSTAQSNYLAGGTAAALSAARTAANAADARCNTDQRTENTDAALVVTLGADLGRCQTPPTPCNCPTPTPVPTVTPVPLPGPDTPPIVVPSSPVIVQSPPVFVQSPQVGTVPSGSVSTGDGSLAE
jgi:hypothetical protein